MHAKNEAWPTRSPGVALSLSLGLAVACGVTESGPGLDDTVGAPAEGGASGRSTGAGGAGGSVGSADAGGGGPGGNPTGAGTGDASRDGGAAGAGMARVADGGGTPNSGDTALAAASSGVTINGMFVPKERVLVFVHIGHSNMAGRATGPADQTPYFYGVDPQLWSYHWMQPTRATGAFTWRAAKEPLSPDSMTGNMAGPGMAILHAAQQVAPKDAFIVSTGHGHSGMEGGYCSNFKKGGLLYKFAMGPAMDLKGKVTFAAIFTMLGTTERHLDVAAQTGFSDCMKQVATDMRNDLGDPDIPFIMGDFEMEATGDTAPTLPYAKIIIEQLRLATMKIPRSGLISTEKIAMQDSHHFNMAGHREWGLRGIKVMLDRGLAPWAK